MTKKKKMTADEPKVDETNVEAVAKEKPLEKVEDLLDEQDRRVVIVASVFLVLLVAPVFLPVQSERSLWRMTRHDDTGRAILGAIMGWPALLGVFGLIRGWRKRLPGKVLVGFATTFASLQTLAGLALMAMLLWFGRGDERSWPVFLAALFPLLGAGLVVRSFSRTGWQRWQHLMAPIALLAAMIVMCLFGAEPNAINRAEQGGWVFLFATAALLPFVGTVVRSKKSA